jgi:hypothetical protein
MWWMWWGSTPRAKAARLWVRYFLAAWLQPAGSWLLKGLFPLACRSGRGARGEGELVGCGVIGV